MQTSALMIIVGFISAVYRFMDETEIELVGFYSCLCDIVGKVILDILGIRWVKGNDFGI